MIQQTFNVQGLRELDRALSELPKATARNVLVRTLKKAAAPIVEVAEAKLPSPGRTGAGHLRRRGIIVTTRKPKGADSGKTAYAETLSGGGTRAEASTALRAARAADPNAFAEVFIGPATNDPAAMMQEFGTVHHPPQPYMRPAIDSQAQTAIGIIQRELGAEIEKSAQRLARKRARAR